jgi:hypothetical protein
MIYQQFRSAPGRRLVARLEQPVEVGQDIRRFFLDGQSMSWTEDPAARIAAAEDPTLPGVYVVRIPTDFVRSVPAQVLSLAVLDTDPALAAVPLVELMQFALYGGDDGSKPMPSADLVWHDGRIVHFYGAYVKTAP